MFSAPQMPSPHPGLPHPQKGLRRWRNRSWRSHSWRRRRKKPVDPGTAQVIAYDGLQPNLLGTWDLPSLVSWLAQEGPRKL